MRVPIGDVEISYVDEGRGVPVVLIHGFPLDRTMWDAQVAALSREARVIAPDLRGFGASSAGHRPSLMETFASDVRGLLDHLGVDGVVVCGLSMGGYVSLAFARLYPERLRGVVLCDTRSTADAPEARAGRARLAERVRAEGVGVVADQMLPKLFAPATYARRPEAVARMERVMRGLGPDGVAAALLGMAERPDATAFLSRIVCPALVLVGEHDTITPAADSEAIATAIPGARLTVIPEAGHMAPVENPEAVNAAIRGFLGAIGSGRA